MIIALDYDRTYTADPRLWDGFVVQAVEAGHRVICCTQRYPTEPIQMRCEVIYSSREKKGPYLASLGIHPNIWIDDTPMFIW